MRQTLAITALLLAGCASASGTGSSPGPQQIAIGPSGGQYSNADLRSGIFAATFATRPRRAPDSLAVPASRAWPALRAAYAANGLPVSVADSVSHILGAVDYYLHGRIGREPASHFLSCGEGADGPNADRYSVKLTVASELEPAGSGQSTLATYVSATASNPGLSNRLPCTSTGLLEERLAEAVRKGL